MRLPLDRDGRVREHLPHLVGSDGIRWPSLVVALAASGDAPGTVKSPMVGTVYAAAEPGKPPFVKVGDRVKEGQTLLIIEAMKVMNALPSPRAGTVTAIHVSDGQPVEYGEPLLVIE